MFNNINTYQRFFSGDLSVAVIEISNPAGSAKTEETEESTSNLYLAISETDTYPKQNLFCIKDLYAIRNIKQDNSVAGELRVSFTYVDLTQKKPLKKDITLKIGLETVTVIKSN
jgi:hypothetical protein